MTIATPVLSVRDVSMHYPTGAGVVQAVHRASFDIHRGEILGLTGESGSGKSSLALALMKLTRPPGEIFSGQVLLGGVNLLALTERELTTIRGRDIGLILQNPRSALNPMLRIGVQISDAYRAHNRVSKSAAGRRALEMLQLVGINDPERRSYAYPHELSGGMAQRALIATALVCEPKLLIADEPTSGLDVTVQAQILDDLARSVRKTGSAVLMISQNLGVVANYCDRVLVMHGGMIVESSSTDDFFRHPAHPASGALLTEQRSGLRSHSQRISPDLRDVGGKCNVNSWCSLADGVRCSTEEPVLVEVESEHAVRCHFAERLYAESASFEQLESNTGL